MNPEDQKNSSPSKGRPKIKIFVAILVVCLVASIPLLFMKTNLKEVVANEPLILVSVPPYKKMIGSLVGNRFRVESVVPNGFDPHLYEAKPQDMKKLKDAVLWFGIGEAFEYQLLEALKSAGISVQYVNLLQEIEKKGFKNYLIPFDDKHHDCSNPEHNHEHHCPLNPYDRHIWLGLELDSLQAQIIVEKLTESYPYFKGVFEGYLEELMREHDVLINWIESNIKDQRPISFLTPHPAFSYFAKEFDVTQIPIEVAGKEPNIQDLSNLLKDLKTQNVDCVIVQPQHSKKAAEYIARDLEVPVYNIDPYNENYLDTCNRLGMSLANKRKPVANAGN
jgi:zinc transport system substrate-binding protein